MHEVKQPLKIVATDVYARGGVLQSCKNFVFAFFSPNNQLYRRIQSSLGPMAHLLAPQKSIFIRELEDSDPATVAELRYIKIARGATYYSICRVAEYCRLQRATLRNMSQGRTLKIGRRGRGRAPMLTSSMLLTARSTFRHHFGSK